MSKWEKTRKNLNNSYGSRTKMTSAVVHWFKYPHSNVNHIVHLGFKDAVGIIKSYDILELLLH